MKGLCLGLGAVVLGLLGCSGQSVELTAAKLNELKLPVEVTGKPGAWEIARIWKTDSGQTVLLAPADTWGAEEWGLMLTDLARHVANSKNLNKGTDKAAFLKRMKEFLDKEWDDPTDTPTGRLGN